MFSDLEKNRNRKLLGLKLITENTEINEERITNKEAADYINSRENFVGSHTYGEDLGGKGQMYVAYSYGEQHPLYMWSADDNRWYYNTDDYITEEGKPNVWTRKHLRDLKPNNEIQGIPKSLMLKKVSNFKQQNNIGDNIHTDLEPGEK